MCFLTVTTTSTLRDMGSCEEEGLFSRSLTVFQNFLGLADQADSIPIYSGRGHEGRLAHSIFLASVYDKSGRVVSLISHFEHGL
jgi:hypothetical protein